MITPILVIVGDIHARTGGYIYDKNILELGKLALHNLDEIPDLSGLTAPLLIDGLAFGQFTLAQLQSIEAPITALVHHPLCLETGLSETEQAKLFASEKQALGFAKSIVVTSKMTKTKLVKQFEIAPEKITIAEPGVTTRPKSTKVNVKFPAILNIGTLSPRKNQVGLIEALAPLRGEKWHLNLVGSPHRYPEYAARVSAAILQHNLQERVTMHGELDDEALNKIYAKASLFVLSSLYEGYGMVLSEAMSAALPIITTTGGAAGECVPQKAGIKVPPDNREAMTAALKTMITNRMERSIAAHHSFQAAQNLPTWQDTANLILKAIAR